MQQLVTMYHPVILALTAPTLQGGCEAGAIKFGFMLTTAFTPVNGMITRQILKVQILYG